MNNNNEGAIVIPDNKEMAEHPEYVMDAIERLNLSHPEYEG